MDIPKICRYFIFKKILFSFFCTMATTRREDLVISLVFFIALKVVFNSILTLMQCSMLPNDLSILLIVPTF